MNTEKPPGGLLLRGLVRFPCDQISRLAPAEPADSIDRSCGDWLASADLDDRSVADHPLLLQPGDGPPA